MPVPKRKTSKSRRDQRQSCKFIRPKAITLCGNCQDPLATHQACPKCGFYKGAKVMNTKAERNIKRVEARKAQQERAKLRASDRAHEGSEDHHHEGEK